MYNKVLKKISEKGNETSEIFGDINFKVSSILQGQSQLPLALNHLMIAKKTYRSCIDSEVGELDVLVAKLIEIVTGIANIYVDQGEIDNAAETYKVRDSREFHEISLHDKQHLSHTSNTST